MNGRGERGDKVDILWSLDFSVHLELVYQCLAYISWIIILKLRLN